MTRALSSPSKPRGTQPERPFLTAEWRNLAILNYEVDPQWLSPWLPAFTELDSFSGRHYVSLIGFEFLNTAIRGVPIPFHRNFLEVNLRFYVKRQVGDECRRGVVFVKEIVPKPAVACIARTIYGENYVHAPMTSRIVEKSGVERAPSISLHEYTWRMGRVNHRLALESEGEKFLPTEGTLEHFVVNHYWGYCRQRDGGTTEYRIERSSWHVRSARQASYEGYAASLYGERLGTLLGSPPASAFHADGSPVLVYPGRRVVG